MKRFARICTVLMVLVMVFSLCTTAYAAGSVTYDADANKFIFAPGTKESPTSLFENFQNVMPGDSLTEQIEIRNNRTTNRTKIKVYLRSLGAQEDTDDFLSQLTLTVKQRGQSVLFEAPADETAQLTDWVYLGTVYSGGKIKLDLTLDVPITMGNDYQNQIGYIDWEFKVDELPVSSTAQTGDNSNIYFYAVTMALSIGALIVLILIKRKKKEESK